ncbi:MAG: DUF1573 domain-containing protein [Saprospiraceae bacterium]|nr:DUF1573 domain-containing protein [Saprospiraceae bacterium]
MKHLLSLTIAAALLFGLNSCKKTEASVADDKVAVKADADGKTTNQLSTSSSTVSAGIDQTTIAFDKEKHDFGQIKEGEKVKTTFQLTNSGDHDLIINRAQGSCGCTVPDVSEFKNKPIKPGESVEVDVEFDSRNRTGNQTKQVKFYGNIAPNPTTVTITAKVEADPNKPKAAAPAAGPKVEVTPSKATETGHEGHNH